MGLTSRRICLSFTEVLVVKVPWLGKCGLLIAVVSIIILTTVAVVFAFTPDLGSWFPDPNYSDKYGIVAATKIEELLSDGIRIWHDPISEEFAEKAGYWNLTDPDRYVLEAINDLGKMVLVSNNTPDLTIVKQMEQHSWKAIVNYEGTFYLITIYGTPMHRWA